MVLIRNDGERDAQLDWENQRYLIGPGQTCSITNTAARALFARYPSCVEVKSAEEVVEAKQPVSEDTFELGESDVVETKKKRGRQKKY